MTSTLGCTANFPGNWCSQPVILRPFGRSGQELPVEYHGRITLHKFLEILIKKAIDRGQDLEISGNPLSKQRFHSDGAGTKIIGKSHTKKTNFLYVYPLLALRPDLDSSQDSRKVSRGIFRKIKKMAKL